MSDQIIYGINPVLEALRSDRQPLNKILLAAGKEGGPIRLVHQLAREKGIPVQISPKEALDRLVGIRHHQGVLGFPAASSYSTWEDLLDRVRSDQGKSIVLILDSIEDPQNLGSLIRTAEACGVKGIILPKDRAAGITPAVVKASAGAVAHLPPGRGTNRAGTRGALKEEGFGRVGGLPSGEKPL